jgi:CubicO group peptidase (beta-lactamase class C family)
MRTFPRAALIAAVLLAPSPSLAVQQPTISGDIASRINALIKPALEAQLFSGVIMVARGDEIIYHEPFGFADWELRAPNTTATRFGIASLTKAMTETVVEILVREGRLHLDSPIEQYIEDFPRGPDGGIPMLEHLYTHRSGVPHRVTDPIDETQVLHAIDVVERVKQQGLLFEPGTKRQYSSTGFVVLARVIEIVEGKPFEQVLEERVFRPAGMHSATSETGRQLMRGRASPHNLGVLDMEIVVVNAARTDLRFLTGAGSVYATTEDLLQFLRAMHNGIFGPEIWDQAVDADATTWRGWSGRTGGYEAYMDVLPDRDLNFVLVTICSPRPTGRRGPRFCPSWPARKSSRSGCHLP